MAHIFLIAGHGAGDSGAVGNGYTEAERVRVLAKKISELGGSSVTLGDTSRDWYADGGINNLSIPKDYQILELHMDSNKSLSPKGGHVIIKEGYKPDKYDQALADFIGKILPGRSELIVKRGDLANPKRAAAKGYGYRLVEFGFITNAGDVSIFNNKMNEIAEGVLQAFNIKISESGGSATENKSEQTTNKEKDLVKQSQHHMNNVLHQNESLGGKIAEDGIVGPDTKKSRIMLYQYCHNLDTGESIPVDGLMGPKTEAAMSKDSIKKGYVGYLASFLEIALMSHGYDPKGVEWAGEIGSGCVNAGMQFQKDRGYYGGKEVIFGYTTIKDLLS